MSANRRCSTGWRGDRLRWSTIRPGSRAIALYASLRPYEAAPQEDDAPPELPEDRPLQLAIVGRPNVGKSTLVNRLIGEDRMLTGPEPGITRDAIAIDWAWRGRAIRLVDTAGLRRRSRVDDRLGPPSDPPTAAGGGLCRTPDPGAGPAA